VPIRRVSGVFYFLNILGTHVGTRFKFG
jgi:hypothetical protein